MGRIQNFEPLANTKLRRDLLEIAQAGLEAIDTEKVIRQKVSIRDRKLQISDKSFDLSKFKNIKVVGFGKVSCAAGAALEYVLGNQLASGITIGTAHAACEVIKAYDGNHPQPSELNVQISEQIKNFSQAASAEDLVLVVVSGGGSALLCWPQAECDQGQKLYREFVKTGGNIKELNTIRKHISQLKGGGLAKVLYPATVVALIFSDVPGGDYSEVASGPTFPDSTTIADAQKVIDKYQLGGFDLNETTKEKKYFEKITNIPLVSNTDALEAMQGAAIRLNYKTKIMSKQAYEPTEAVVGEMIMRASPNTAILVGGEPQMKVIKQGSGGRNLFASLKALQKIKPNQAFLSLASDGMDNSDSAGAIADQISLNLCQSQKLKMPDYASRLDSYNFFQNLNQLIFTGPTHANVSDLLILLTS